MLTINFKKVLANGKFTSVNTFSLEQWTNRQDLCFSACFCSEFRRKIFCSELLRGTQITQIQEMQIKMASQQHKKIQRNRSVVFSFGSVINCNIECSEVNSFSTVDYTVQGNSNVFSCTFFKMLSLFIVSAAENKVYEFIYPSFYFLYHLSYKESQRTWSLFQRTQYTRGTI